MGQAVTPTLNGRHRLPDDAYYADSGCDVHPSCLRCPLPACRYDHPEGVNGVLREQRNAQIRDAINEGLTWMQVAERFGISPRQLARVLGKPGALA